MEEGGNDNECNLSSRTGFHAGSKTEIQLCEKIDFMQVQKLKFTCAKTLISMQIEKVKLWCLRIDDFGYSIGACEFQLLNLHEINVDPILCPRLQC